jgi:hypothetical protein
MAEEKRFSEAAHGSCRLIEKVVIPGDRLYLIAFYGKRPSYWMARSVVRQTRETSSAFSSLGSRWTLGGPGNAMDVLKARLERRGRWRLSTFS